MRVVARRRHDLRDLPVQVELDRKLDGVEIDRPAGFARLQQRLEYRMQVLEMRQERSDRGVRDLRRRRQPSAARQLAGWRWPARLW